jgi:Spy/CpxP family protein refolding chaperone
MRDRRYRTLRRPAATAAALILAGCAWAPAALAQGPGAWPGARGLGGAGVLPLMLRSANLTPDQQDRVRSIVSARRAAVRALVQQLRQAQDELADGLLAPATTQAADLDPQLQKIGQLRQQLLQSSAQTALEIRAVLTPEQLARVTKSKDRLRQLRSEIHQVLTGSQP